MNNCSQNNGTADFPAVQWQVPQNPYGVMGGVLLIIIFASVISVCSLRKLHRANNNERRYHIDLSTHPSSAFTNKEEAGKVVVLMPGDEYPTFIAQPTSVIENIIGAQSQNAIPCLLTNQLGGQSSQMVDKMENQTS